MEDDKTQLQNPSGTAPLNQSQPVADPDFTKSAVPVGSAAPVQQPESIAQPPSSPPPPNPLPPASEPVKRKFSFPFSLLKIVLGFIVVVIVLGLVFFLISSFGSKKTNQNVTLTYWGLWEDNKTMQPIIDDFQRQNPNIKVNYVKEDIKQYRETLDTRTNNGNGPDIFLFHNSWFPMISTLLIPFPSDVISKQEFAQDFYPVSQTDLIKSGAIYGVPAEMDTLAMYVNRDIFDNAGKTAPTNWNDFIDDARALTVKDENGKIKTAGAAMGTFDNVSNAPDILSLLFLQNSVDFNNLASSSDRVDGALNFYTSFANDANNVWDATLDPSILAFSKGNLAMFFGYSWDFFTIKAYNPNLNFQIFPVPQLADQSVNIASYWASGVSAKSVHQKEALQFVKFLAQKSTQQSLYLEESKERAFGQPYARVDLAESLKDNPLVYPFVLQAKTAGSSYFVDNTYDNGLNQQLNTYLGNAVNSINDGTSVQTAFELFSKGVDQVMQKYGK